MRPPLPTLGRPSSPVGDGGRGSREAASSERMRMLSALPMLPNGTTSALNFAATRTKSVLSGQKSLYLSPGPWQASRAPPGKSSTASPRCRSLKKFRGVTGTAPHFAKPPPTPKFSPTPALCGPSWSSFSEPSACRPPGERWRGSGSSSPSNSACAPASDTRAAARSSKGRPVKSRRSGAGDAGGPSTIMEARTSGKFMGCARPRGAKPFSMRNSRTSGPRSSARAWWLPTRITGRPTSAGSGTPARPRRRSPVEASLLRNTGDTSVAMGSMAADPSSSNCSEGGV
mmetsp:Transcript_82177/g.255182  ORF Transcript_82177/g.255182 Transcript_82177/m.255182 type:complete len:286 (-) Transcript_82177:131-988(-)